MLRAVRRGLVAPVVAGALLLAASPAWAHVEVEPDHAAEGARDVTLTFHVPNEEAGATTTRIELLLPTDHPLTGVAAVPVGGWSARVEPSRITWTGGVIAGDAEEEFAITVAQLPTDAASLTFKALQTYSTGEVVAWIEVAAAGAGEPEHPAPTVTLTGPAGESAPAGRQVAAPGDGVPPSGTGVSMNTVAKAVGAALLLGAAAVVAVRRRRSRSGGPATPSGRAGRR